MRACGQLPACDVHLLLAAAAAARRRGPAAEAPSRTPAGRHPRAGYLCFFFFAGAAFSDTGTFDTEVAPVFERDVIVSVAESLCARAS